MPELNHNDQKHLERPFCFAFELESAEIKQPSYLLDSLIPRGRLILGVGDSTQGKTPFGLQLARDVAGGLNFLDRYKHSGDPTRVALIDAESTKEDIGLRLRMQGQARQVDTGKNLLLFDVDNVFGSDFDLTQKGIDRMRELVGDEKVDLLMLDNLWALSGGQDILAGKVVQPILHGLRKITRLDHSPSVMSFHHPRKSADKQSLPDLSQGDFARWAEEASGSRILFNLTDVRFGLQRTERAGEEYTIFRGRSRVPGIEQEFGPLYLTVDEQHSLALIDSRPSVVEMFGPKEKKVLEAMRRFGEFGTKEARLATAGEIGDRTIGRAFRHGREHGILTVLRPGIYVWAERNGLPVQ